MQTKKRKTGHSLRKEAYRCLERGLSTTIRETPESSPKFAKKNRTLITLSHPMKEL